MRIMIGRSAIRNPWIFAKSGSCRLGRSCFIRPWRMFIHTFSRSSMHWRKEGASGRKAWPLEKISQLHCSLRGRSRCISLRMRRARLRSEMDSVCRKYLLDEGEKDRSINELSPYQGLLAHIHPRKPSHVWGRVMFYSIRLSFVQWGREWLLPISASLTSFFLLWAAHPPRQGPESAYLFLLPVLIWFHFHPSFRKTLICILLSGWVYQIMMVGWMRHISMGGMITATFLLSCFQSVWFWWQDHG